MHDGIEIRALREEEFHANVELSALAFGEEIPKEDEEAYRQAYPFERSLGAFEGGRMVATSAVFSLELTLPGGVAVPMGGVTWIGTLPTHRRRGLLSRLMAAQFADMADRGEMISGLGASEGNIYGRFGYGPATSVVDFSVERPYAAFARSIDMRDRGSHHLARCRPSGGTAARHLRKPPPATARRREPSARYLERAPARSHGRAGRRERHVSRRP